MQSPSFLTQTMALFGAALVVAWLFRVARAPAIIGFLFSGLALGPSGLKLIAPDAIAQFADLGLVMLLFIIGLELSPEPLVHMGRRLAAATALQVALTTAAVFALAVGLRAMPIPAALVLGVAVSLSSTAIVFNQLTEKGQTGTTAGTLIAGILLLQDLLVILLMLFLPLLGMGRGGSLTDSAVRAAVSLAVLVAVTIIARRLLPYSLQMVLRWGGRELLTLFAVVMAVAGACVAERAGWSAALGACLAGLLLSQTPLRHQLSAEILPFRDVFNALFFISMGMLVNLREIAPSIPIIGLAVGLALTGKCVLTALAVRLTGWPIRLAVYSGVTLCTVSEFAYVLAREADRLGVLPSGTLPRFTAFVVATMLVGAMFYPLASRLSLTITRWIGAKRAGQVEHEPALSGLQAHVIVIGYGLNGQNLARVLTATKIPFCVIEMNHSLAELAREAGHQVIVGDAARQAILSRARLVSARALVTAINDTEATRRIVAQARAARNDLYILARTRFVTELEILHRLGAHEVIPEEFETSIEIFAHVLKHFGIPDNIIDAQVALVRAGNYGMLRGRPATTAQRTDVLRLLEATATQTYLLESGSAACGKTIREVELRARTGVTIIAIVRNGKPITNPAPDFCFAAGDVLVLVGGHADVDRAKALLAPDTTTSTDSLPSEPL